MTGCVLPFELPTTWAEGLSEELSKPYMLHLRAFLEQERWSGKVVYPQQDQIFQALELTPLNNVKVVIVGQDPYHGPGQAHGLCFSVQKGVALPPSLKNIFSELESDCQIPPSPHGCLTEWAKQGVLLLNTTLTVRQAEPLSHFKKGWEQFTDAIISLVAKRKKHVVFILWGKNAQDKCRQFASLLSDHLVLTAPHPSPFSAHSGFFGCRHFSKTNGYLAQHGISPIDWRV